MNGKEIELYSTFKLKWRKEERDEIIRKWGRLNKTKYKALWRIKQDFYKECGYNQMNRKEAEKLFTGRGIFAQLAGNFPCVAVRDFEYDNGNKECYFYENMKHLCKDFIRYYEEIFVYYSGDSKRVSIIGFDRCGSYNYMIFPLTSDGAKRFGPWRKYLKPDEVTAGTREFRYQEKTGQLV